MKKVIVGLGEILWDIFPKKKVLGGAPTNFFYHSKQLSDRFAEVKIVSKIGNDLFGDEALDELHHFDTSYIQVDKVKKTGKVFVHLDKNNQPNYNILKDMAWDYIKFDKDLEELSKKTNAVCFGTLCQRSKISKKTIQKFLTLTSPECLKVFDINLRGFFYNKEIIKSSLNFANVLKINEQEIKIVAKMFGLNGCVETLLQKICDRFNLKIGVLTLGEKGSIIHKKGVNYYTITPKIKLVDPVGAGDSFTASLVVGLLRGYNLDYINLCANRVAAYVCSQNGASVQLPKRLKKLFLI